MADAPTTAYTEVQIDDDSISLTLISESQDGATIEDTERFTFDELQEMQGEHFSLHLSGESQELLSEQRQEAAVGDLLQEDPTGGTGGGGSPDSASRESGLPQVGDVVIDGNPPSWSEDARMEVVEVLPDVSADEYIIESMDESRVNSVAEQSDGHIEFHESTVADANPSYDEDDAVVIACYADGDSTEYAFPAGRIEEWDAAGTTMTSAFE